MTSEAESSRGRDLDQIVIRSWPKIVFLYPVMLTALGCGIFQLWSGATGEADRPFSEAAGMIFFVVLAMNLLVIAFEFSRFKTLALFFFLLAVLFLLLYLSTLFEVFTFLRQIFDKFHLSASTALYFCMALYLFVVFCVVYVHTRFDFWVVRSNEISHKEGFMGDTKRFPSPNLKMTKEIPDVFEFLLLRSGRIVLYPASEKQAMVLDHVIGVNRAELAIQELLSSVSVEIEHHHGQHPQDEEEPSATGH
jgi:hypothetical protein